MVILSLPIPGTNQTADVTLDAANYARLTAEGWTPAIVRRGGLLYCRIHRPIPGTSRPNTRHQWDYLHRWVAGLAPGDLRAAHHVGHLCDPLASLNCTAENIQIMTPSEHASHHGYARKHQGPVIYYYH